MIEVVIPVIDVPDLGTAEGDARIAQEVLDAYGQWGFAYIVGHPIDPSLLAAVFDQSQRFHALPLADKLALAAGTEHRGYIPFKTSTDVTSSVETVTKPNQSESFMMIGAIPQGRYLAGEDRWPDLPGFAETMTAYQEAMTAFAHALMTVIGSALDDDGRLVAAFDEPTTWLRLLHYPPQDPQSPADEYGSAPHTDFGAITLLAQDDVGGLSVKSPDGDWLDVPPMDGAFVMNVGDMLHRWSNGRLRSTPHRVTNRSGRERYSVPFFYDPCVTATITPLASQGAPRFKPLAFDAFLRSQLEASYDNHRPATA
jgi:isopenicillin N synthase-like dioxygenase